VVLGTDSFVMFNLFGCWVYGRRTMHFHQGLLLSVLKVHWPCIYLEILRKSSGQVTNGRAGIPFSVHLVV
jgi:hypothetical protein